MPNKCVIGVDLNLTVHLRAGDQQMREVQVPFYRHPAIPMMVSGHCQGIKIGLERAQLPNIEPNAMYDLKLVVRFSSKNDKINALQQSPLGSERSERGGSPRTSKSEALFLRLLIFEGREIASAAHQQVGEGRVDHGAAMADR
jgi:hypothetical protein